MCDDTLRTGLDFLRRLIWGVTIPRFTIKNEDFPIYLFGNPHKCVLIPSEQGLYFLRQLIWGVTCLVLPLKNECFTTIYLLGNHVHVCWNPQNRACLPKTINLRGHIPRFTWKMNVFPCISLETPYMCDDTLRTGLDFLKTINLLCHIPWFTLKNETFCHLSPWKLHNCVLKPSEQGSLFSKTIDFRVTCLGLLEKWTFSHLISLETMYMCVETLRTGLVYPRQSI